MLTLVLETKILFEDSAMINCLRYIGLSREHPQYSEPLQSELNSTSKAPPPRIIQEQTLIPEALPSGFSYGSTFLLHSEITSNGHQDLRLQSCRISTPTLKMCNAHTLKWTIMKFSTAISTIASSITTVTTDPHVKIV